MLNLKLSKEDLDKSSSIFGLITGLSIFFASMIATYPGETLVGVEKSYLGWGVGAIGGASKIVEGWLANKPANKAPTTEDLEGS